MAGGPRRTRLRWGGHWGTVRSTATTPPGTLVEAEALYNLLEREVIPEFYARDGNGIPTAWIKRMRESMALLTPRFSADRTSARIHGARYLPAATAFRERAANKGAVGRQIVDWQHAVERAGGRCASERCGSTQAPSTTCLRSRSS